MSHQQNKAALFGRAAGAPASAPISSGATKPKGLTTGLTTTTKGPLQGTSTSVTGGGVLLSNEMRLKKIEEARDFSERGMKAIKVTVFQWKADHLLAAPLFESSSNAYKAAGEFEQARVMMVQSAKSHEGYGALSTCAVAYMNAAKIAQAQNNKVQAAEHFKESAEMWGSHGDVEKCADVLAKAAKELENEKPTEALDLYNRAIEILAPDGLTKEQLGKVNINIRDILREAFKYTLKRGEKDSKSLKDALSLAKRMAKQFEAFESEPSMCKSMASVTIILLSMGDVVQADQTYLQEHLDNKHYITSNECKVIDKFIMAFKNSDLDLLDDAQKGENLFYLDPEMQSWAKSLSLFGRGKFSKGDSKITRELKGLTLTSTSTPAPAPAASTSPAPPPPTADDDDDALC